MVAIHHVPAAAGVVSPGELQLELLVLALRPRKHQRVMQIDRNPERVRHGQAEFSERHHGHP